MPKRTRKKRKVWQWHKSFLPHTPVPENKFNTRNLEDTDTPSEYFICMVGSELFSMIAEESNKYLYQMRNERVKPVTTEEMRKFVGILMYMSLVRLPQRRMYWS